MRLKEIAATAVDEAGLDTVQMMKKHDKRFHPNGYKPGEECKYRKLLAADDNQDRVVSWTLGRDTDGLPGGVEVAICDITKEKTDAIVNAANRWMLGGGGVDGAIHRAAGPQLLAECKQYPPDENGYRVQTGEAKITGGGNLAAKHVIHTAGPDIRDEEAKDDPENGGKLLRASYRNSLEAAKKAGCKSVSFPSISTGIFGYPLEKAAQFAAEEIEGFLAKNPDMSVRMCIYDPFDSEKIAAAYESAFKAAEKKIAKRGGISSAPEAEDESPEVSNLRHLLRTNSISKRDFSSSLAALAALGKISKARVGLIKRQMFVEDAAPDAEASNGGQLTDLQKHDAKYHGGHYDGKSACKYRDDLAKGDKTDNLDPENVEGEEAVNGNNPVTSAKAALDKALQGGGSIKDIGDALSDYEKAYNAASGGAGVNALQGVLSKVQAKSPNGIVSQIIAKRLAAAKAASASANLPKGTMTPDEARNYAAAEIAKMLGANLTAPAAGGGNPSGSGAVPSASQAASQPKTASAQQQASQPAPATANQQPTTNNLGPNAPLPHAFTQLPSGMNLDDFAKWPRGGGSTGLRIYTDPNTGKRYGVKKSGGMPQGVNIPRDVLAEDWMADQALRMAGLNAPDGIIAVNPTDNDLYKVTEWNENIKGGIGSMGKGHAKQLAEAYPMMAFLYNMDASQNGDNILVDNNGDLVFTDNGSSFGNRAQGGVNSWYVKRDEADSTKSEYGIAQLAQHGDQSMWSDALGVSSINGTYGNTISQADQDTILKEAAKYEMGKIARAVFAEMQSRIGVKPTDKKYQNMVKWADSLDKLASKYKTAKPTVAAASAPTSSTGNTQTPTSAIAPSPATAPASSQTTTAAAASQSGQWQMPTGPVAFSPSNPNHHALFQQAHSSWQVPGANTPTNQLRNAQTIIAAVSAAAGAPHSVLPHLSNAQLANIVRNGTFTANARGIGGTVTGVNLPRKGIQSFQKSVNSILNPQGIKMQVHNNGNITFSATNRSIAQQALASAGMATTPAAPAATPTPAATATPTPPTAPSSSSPAAATPQPQSSQGKTWQNHLAGLQQGPGATNQQLNAAYQGISNWLNNAGV